MALAFAIVIAPNAWWLVHEGFLPFQYVDERARTAAHWYEYIVFPLEWTGGQLLTLLPTLALLLLLYRHRDQRPTLAADEVSAFNRRYVAMLALGPFLVTTVVATLLGRLAIAMWGYPLWSFAPLAVLLWLKPIEQPWRLRHFAAGALATLTVFPMIYVATEIGEPFLRDPPKATPVP